MGKSFGNRTARNLAISVLSVVLIFMSVAAAAQNVGAQATQTKYEGPLEKAGTFGRQSPKNVGIYIVYGTGNRVTPDQAGEHATKKLREYAQSQSKHFNTQYHVAFNNREEGIWVGYLVGGGEGVGPYEIRKGVKPDVLDKVFEQRESTARLLE